MRKEMTIFGNVLKVHAKKFEFNFHREQKTWPLDYL